MALFISFEGPEGAGKTTQVQLLREFLTESGHNVLVTRQPGGDPVGVQLRKIMLELGRTSVHPTAELLMMMADRAQSVETVIRPHLLSGGTVICDRYSDSSIAYQGGGRGLDRTKIAQLNDFATGGLYPDITIFLDLDPAIGLSRQQHKTKMEMEDLAFHHRVRDGYLQLLSNNPLRIHLVDATQPVEVVQDEIRTVLSRKGC